MERWRFRAVHSETEAAATPDDQTASPADWPDNTFVQEPEDQLHYLGSHWEAFYEDSNDLFNNLPRILSQTSILNGYFFDVSYLLNRCWYESGKSYQFILSGLAYKAELCEVNELPIKQNPDIRKWRREVLQRMGEEAWADRDLETLQLRGSAILMPIREWDRDDYWFRGVARDVKPFDNWLGQHGWQVRVTVHRFDGMEGDLDIFITQRTWPADGPPQIDQEIEGEIWLHGHLWRPCFERGA